MSKYSLNGKRAVIFGGAGAIGTATARTLANAGATIILVDRGNPELEPKIAENLAALPGAKHQFRALEITDSPALFALRDDLSADGLPVNILINAAGFTRTVPHANLDALNDDLIDEILRVNWRAQFATIRSFAPLLKASGDGVVVSLSSIASFTGVGSNIAYCAAKAGIDVMTKALARVLAPEVRVLAISPGVVDTTFVPGRDAEASARIASGIPLKRIASADDIADAILACCTHLTYSTGHIIQVDGGRAL